MDEFYAARGVRKAPAPRPLARAKASPELEKLVDAYLDAQPNTGLLILKDGRVLVERYQYERSAQHRFASGSVAKTVLGMLVGIAVHEKKLGLDDRVDQHVPELKGHPYGETPIRHLLTMSSGMDFNDAYTRGDGSKLILNTIRRQTEGGAHSVLEFNKRDAPAGTRWHYNSGDSQVLGLVLIAATRQPIADYLSEKIWQPMGAEANATWLLDKGGYEAGYCCLNATLRDYARFGLLLANYGALDGKQIIPAEWVKAATTAQAPHLRVGTATRNNGYGYQTWLISHPREGTSPPNALVGGGDPGRFAALGVHGQAIYVDPARQLVVVHTAVWSDPDDRPARGAQFRLWESLLARVSQ